jgi:uncharacterized protein (TIGR00303 family)
LFFDSSFLKVINDPAGRLSYVLSRLSGSRSAARLSGGFLLAVASTATSDIPGISAAGATPELRRLTPRIDAEILSAGKTVDGMPLPVSPSGIVSPVVITRAVVKLLDLPVTVIDCGSFSPPGVDCLTVGTTPAKCLSSGCALERRQVDALFQAGVRIGCRVRDELDYLILSECVPGGTTTGAALLAALGYEARQLVSSSLPEADFALKHSLIESGFMLSGIKPGVSPLDAVAAIGDPMQPVAAGIALAASSKVPVILAGGSQMLAVWALISAIDPAAQGLDERQLAVITTKWVAFDRQAGSARLAALVGAPFAASCPDFTQSRHAGLRAYEEGNVKEGVGAGGAMAAAYLEGRASGIEIVEAIDRQYDELVLGNQAYLSAASSPAPYTVL